MKCKHLSPETGTVSEVECHFSKGNTQCPAEEVKFVIVGEALNYAKRVLAARDKRHPKTEAKLMQHVGSQTAAFKLKFYQYLENNGAME